jgi:hypothetical protein
MKPLDFIVIGAQKAGTTSFNKYIQSHPQIFLPLSKDDNFFCSDSKYERGWDQYTESLFDEQAEKQAAGKVTAYYTGYTMSAPQRIYETMPDVKLIALLRNPIERAFSHHRMQVRRNAESRTFGEAVDELTSNGAVEKGRRCRLPDYPSSQVAERWCYLVWGEYGRIISTYLKYFESDQVLVIYTSGLNNEPRNVLKRFFAYIDVDNRFTPPNLEVQYHDSKKRRVRQRGLMSFRSKKWPFLENIKKFLKKRPKVKRIIMRALYQANRVYMKTQKNPKIDFDTRRRLQSYFRPDVKRLENILGERPPWPEFYSN